MELRILYDNEARLGFRSGWGFSCLIGNSLLFDTGAELEVLLYNMQQFKVDLDCIQCIVLSHNHHDHVGGIGILDHLGDVKVFVPKSFSERFKTDLEHHSNVELFEVVEPVQVSDTVKSIGQTGRTIKEQSILVETIGGVVLVTGCAHPGLAHIIDLASDLAEIKGVVGGFHGFDRLALLRNIPLIVPCHCTRMKKELERLYPNSYKKCAAGCKIEI